MSSILRGVYIVGAKRTPFGSPGGKLKYFTPTDLAEVASKAALQSANVNPELVETVTVGNTIQCSSKDGPYVSRHTALRAGVPQSTPCLTVNRLCGSGIQALVCGLQDILLGNANIALTAGTENMSLAPYILRGARFGMKLGSAPEIECSIWNTLTDQHCQISMGITAENLAEKYGLTREECDQFALLSQTRWQKAQESGRFKEEMAPVKVKVKGKEVEMDVDEQPKPDTTLEILSKLPLVFKENGVVTGGNASGNSDGAGAIVIASEEAVKQHNLKPLARIAGYSYVGCDPRIMGIGPAYAIRKVCEKNGIRVQDVDLIDIVDSYASQFLANQKELGLDPSKTNVNGGAIAMGHPLSASGARVTANLVYELKHRKGKYAIGAACIGGGQGIAVLVQNVQ